MRKGFNYVHQPNAEESYKMCMKYIYICFYKATTMVNVS